MTAEQLMNHGFREYPCGKFDKCDRQFQSTVRDSVGKKLFVNVRYWDRRRYGGGQPEGWDAWSQFTDITGNTFNVGLLSCVNMTPPEVVAWFTRAWEAMGCRYYEKDEVPS